MDNVKMVIDALINHKNHLHIERSPIPFEKLLKEVFNKEPRLIFYIYSYNVKSVSLSYDIDFIYNEDLPKSLDDIIIDDGTFTLLDCKVNSPRQLKIITLDVEGLYQRIERYLGEFTGENEGMYAYNAMSYEMKQFTDYQAVIVTLSYVLEAGELNKCMNQSQIKAQQIAKDLTKGINMPPAIKVYLAMSYLNQNTSYDEVAFKAVSKEPYDIIKYPYSQIAYGPLFQHLGVCVGIAHAFKYLMDAFQIECRVICGSVDESGKVDHAWNLVQINHQYFHVDVTYNIGEGVSIHKFMKNDKNMGAYQWNHDKYPKAIGIHYNYDFVERWLEEHGQQLIDAGIDKKYIYPNIIE